MENNFYNDGNLIQAFTFDIDDLKMFGKGYFKTGRCKGQEYNYAYAEALEIIGLLYCANNGGKNGNYHKGVAFVAKELGLSKAKIKSLRKNYKYKSDFIYKIPYNTDKIVNKVIDLLKLKIDEPIVSEFIKKQDSLLWVLIIIRKPFYLIKAVSKLDPKIYKLYNLLNEID